MNVICDGEAKRAVARSINLGFQSEGKQLLPGKDIAVFVRGKKLTSDLSKTIRFKVGREKAKDFLLKECKWSEEQFEQVDWAMLDSTLNNKPDGYKTWLSKQHTGFCRTRRLQVSYYRGLNGEEAWRANCGRVETAAHLCMCPNEDRTKLFIKTTDELEKWMVKNGKSDSELAFWIPTCIMMRGTRNLLDMGLMLPQMRSLARSQDTIG